MNTAYFLINTICNLYLMIVLMRIWLQLARADFYNPVSQFVVKATNPVLKPLRRVIPGFFGIDMAAVLLAILVATLKLVLFKALHIMDASWGTMLLVGALSVLKTAGTMLFWVMIVRALLSWVSQGNNPIEYLLFQLTEPLLAPIRRIIPAMGGLDLSMLVAFIILQVLNFLMGDLIGPLWWQL
ncbi:YggT family protein [Oceanisphaera pacifica]|uniref:YggT family protein n=1 Tax=Oceanisphaera pacifica TaxID=2818389 RepID=A0ABS3NCD4_9GAMM|nr:YggT family protein [Oceanisphaera pacifica]MBO1518195.1 YggT family protein [Oceanisphaera pacifica]